jgi:hypothetical protein
MYINVCYIECRLNIVDTIVGAILSYDLITKSLTVEC